MLEVEGEAYAQVKRNEIAFKTMTSLLERLFIVGTDSQKVVSRTESLESMVLGGIGYVEGATAEDVNGFWYGDWKRIRYLIRYVRWNLAGNGKIQRNSVITHFSRSASSCCGPGPEKTDVLRGMPVYVAARHGSQYMGH